ncbi:TatD family hydrolase [Candidatus Woesearchaeota archaeon]|nr:TatD family hydrolase [Candidatus Woesearchaeota archaeon]
MLMLIDVHAHLDHEMFSKDRDEVVARARAAGVKVIIANGVDPETNRYVLHFAEKYDIVRPALGIYPPDALQEEVSCGGYPLKMLPYDVDEELEKIEKAKPIALGEVGLDYKNCKDANMQKDIFQKFIDLSKKLEIPLIIHSRKAEQEVIDMLDAAGAKKVVLHCFSGRKSLITRAAERGWSFSIPTNVVRSEHFQQMIRQVHISQLLTETDCPYLSPFSGQRNEPAFVIESLKKIADIKGMTVEDAANNIFKNYQDLFLK